MWLQDENQGVMWWEMKSERWGEEEDESCGNSEVKARVLNFETVVSGSYGKVREPE